MKIYVNDKEIKIHAGGKVLDAILKFDKNLIAKIKSNKIDVQDQYGNHVALSGELNEESKIFTKKFEK